MRGCHGESTRGFHAVDVHFRRNVLNRAPGIVAREDQVAAIRRECRLELECRALHGRRQRARFRPPRAGPFTHQDVRTGRVAALPVWRSRNQHERLIRSDIDSELIDFRVHGSAEIFRVGVSPIHQDGAVDVHSSHSSRTSRDEVEGTVPKNHRALFRRAGVDAGGEALGLSPRARPLPLDHPQIVTRVRLPWSPAIRHEEQPPPIGTHERIPIVAKAGKRQHLGRTPRGISPP